MTGDDLCTRPLTEVAELVRRREVSPTEVTGALLDRVARLGPTLNCYISVLGELAWQRAREAEELLARGTYLGPLHGIPLSLKDNIATAGVRTTAGSPILADWVPQTSATVADRLAAAGGVLLAKANLYEFAYGAPHPAYGPTRNPWNRDRTCGGSSSGSAAAVAAGLCYGSLGTDTGGSVRIPAAFCGVVGLKPTYGRVSRAGVVPVGYNLDHVGPIARTVRDAAVLLGVIAGPDPADPTAVTLPVPDYAADLDEGVRGLRVGILRPQSSERIEPEVRAIVGRAYGVIEREGATLSEVALPDLAQARTVMWTISAAEAAEYHRPYLRTRASDYHPVVRSLLETGEFILAADYVRAQRVRQRMALDVRSAMAGVDAVVLPALPVPAYPIGQRTMRVGGEEEDVLSIITRYTALFNLTGHPAIVLPCGFTSEGLPVGVQIVGHPFQEARLLRIAYAYEQAAGLHLRRPPL
ncbi:MAG: amidase [Armatimonadota bacterium]|nr:amidase [Armatimonadota bacterium]MDR7485664.1 amidase [Armatimonadota bacterium]MDR7534299.1 amidase [Armatimonadota bacterium]MDR7535911.1 amidase [Armatimonadota bacterium]